MSNSVRAARNITRTVLGNGLRVLVVPAPGAPSAAVSVHYGVGFRDEAPGRTGFAHLFEHLMIQGSGAMGKREYSERLGYAGGSANGSTHYDYTDFHQVLPDSWLERALFSEAERMRAPHLTEAFLAEQLAAVGGEVQERVHARPHGGFPWPALPGILFSSFPNAHDGYGNLTELRRASLAECTDFFERFYSPGNAVLTVVTAQETDRVLHSVERWFTPLEARPLPRAPHLSEPELTEDRFLWHTDPGVEQTSVAVGYRLPDPSEGLDAYLAAMTLAAQVADWDLAGVRARAKCGFFGPLDTRTPDALVITGQHSGGVSAHTFAEEVRRRLGQLPDQDRVASVAEVLSLSHRGKNDDLLTRCRGIGRMEILFGLGEMFDELAERLSRVTASDVASVGQNLARQHHAVVELTPGPERTRSTPPVPSDLSALPTGQPVTRKEHRSRLPSLGVQTTPSFEDSCEETLPNGLRVLAVRSSGSPLIEARLRLPDTALTTVDSEALEVVAAVLTARVTEEGHATGETVRLRARGDGVHVALSATVPPEHVGSLLRGLFRATSPEALRSEQVEAALTETAPRRHLLRSNPAVGLDLAARRRFLGLPVSQESLSVPTTQEIVRLHRNCVVPEGAVLVLVGDLDPEKLVSEVSHVLSAWTGDAVRPPVTGTYPTEGGYSVHRANTSVAMLRLFASERGSAGTEAARYLATGLFGGYPRARLAELSTHGGGAVPGLVALAGRDVLFGRSRTSIQAALPARSEIEAQHAIRAVLALMRDTDTWTLTEDRARDVREFCAGQLLTVFDSRSALADHLVRVLSRGEGLFDLLELPERLFGTHREEIAAAGRDLFEASCHFGELLVPSGSAKQDHFLRET